MPVNDPFAKLWALGYRDILPIIPPNAPLDPNSKIAKRLAAGEDARGKCPGVRYPNGKWGGLAWTGYQTSIDNLDRWRDMGASIGIRGSGKLAAIDADTRSEDLARTIKDIIEKFTGKKVPIRVGNFPKALYPIRTTEPFPYLCQQFGPKHEDGKRDRVEILTTGKQFVVHGEHPTTGRPYSWPRPLIEFDELPELTPEALREMMAEIRAAVPNPDALHEDGGALIQVDQDSLKGDLNWITEAVAYIGNKTEDFPARESYIGMGYMIKAAIGEEGRSVFLDWCEKWDGGTNDLEIAEADWERMKPPYRRGARKLYQMADEATGGKFFAERNHEEVIKEEVIAPGGMAWPYRFPELSKIPKRRWLYGGHYRRKTVSATVAPSKVGKSSLGIVEGLAMASGKALLGFKPEGQFRVWIWNGEDDLQELELRVAACMKHYGLTREDVGDRLYLNSGLDTPLVIATAAKVGATIAIPLVDAVIAEIQKHQIDVMIVDPFVTVHRVSENDNNAIDMVAKTWVRIAVKANCAIEVVHHTRKMNGEDSTADDARGASAMVAASRSIRALSRMGEAEARSLGLTNAAASLFRVTAMSGNMAPAAASSKTKWFRLIGVAAGNGEGDDMEALLNGDQVGVVTLFDTGQEAKEMMEKVGSGDSEKKIRAQVASRPQRADVRSSEWVGHAFAEALGLPIHGADEVAEHNRSLVKSAIRDWFNRKLLREISRVDKDYKTRTYVELADYTAKIEATDDLFG